jgi:hypothetical protein
MILLNTYLTLCLSSLLIASNFSQRFYDISRDKAVNTEIQVLKAALLTSTIPNDLQHSNSRNLSPSSSTPQAPQQSQLSLTQKEQKNKLLCTSLINAADQWSSLLLYSNIQRMGSICHWYLFFYNLKDDSKLPGICPNREVDKRTAEHLALFAPVYLPDSESIKRKEGKMPSSIITCKILGLNSESLKNVPFSSSFLDSLSTTSVKHVINNSSAMIPISTYNILMTAYYYQIQPILPTYSHIMMVSENLSLLKLNFSAYFAMWQCGFSPSFPPLITSPLVLGDNINTLEANQYATWQNGRKRKVYVAEQVFIQQHNLPILDAAFFNWLLTSVLPPVIELSARKKDLLPSLSLFSPSVDMIWCYAAYHYGKTVFSSQTRSDDEYVPCALITKGVAPIIHKNAFIRSAQQEEKQRKVLEERKGAKVKTKSSDATTAVSGGMKLSRQHQFQKHLREDKSRRSLLAVKGESKSTQSRTYPLLSLTDLQRYKEVQLELKFLDSESRKRMFILYSELYPTWVVSPESEELDPCKYVNNHLVKRYKLEETCLASFYNTFEEKNIGSSNLDGRSI